MGKHMQRLFLEMQRGPQGLKTIPEKEMETQTLLQMWQ